MALSTLVNIGLCDGMLPDGTKLLPEQTLTYHQLGPLPFTNGTTIRNAQECITITPLKITHLKSKPHPPGNNELTPLQGITL